MQPAAARPRPRNPARWRAPRRAPPTAPAGGECVARSSCVTAAAAPLLIEWASGSTSGSRGDGSIGGHSTAVSGLPAACPPACHAIPMHRPAVSRPQERMCISQAQRQCILAAWQQYQGEVQQARQQARACVYRLRPGGTPPDVPGSLSGAAQVCRLWRRLRCCSCLPAELAVTRTRWLAGWLVGWRLVSTQPAHLLHTERRHEFRC
jgi:hypothetical protein